MKTLPITRYRFFQKLQPLSLLKKLLGRRLLVAYRYSIPQVLGQYM